MILIIEFIDFINLFFFKLFKKFFMKFDKDLYYKNKNVKF